MTCKSKEYLQPGDGFIEPSGYFTRGHRCIVIATDGNYYSAINLVTREIFSSYGRKDGALAMKKTWDPLGEPLSNKSSETA